MEAFKIPFVPPASSQSAAEPPTAGPQARQHLGAREDQKSNPRGSATDPFDEDADSQLLLLLECLEQQDPSNQPTAPPPSSLQGDTAKDPWADDTDPTLQELIKRTFEECSSDHLTASHPPPSLQPAPSSSSLRPARPPSILRPAPASKSLRSVRFSETLWKARPTKRKASEVVDDLKETWKTIAAPSVITSFVCQDTRATVEVLATAYTMPPRAAAVPSLAAHIAPSRTVTDNREVSIPVLIAPPRTTAPQRITAAAAHVMPVASALVPETPTKWWTRKLAEILKKDVSWVLQRTSAAPTPPAVLAMLAAFEKIAKTNGSEIKDPKSKITTKFSILLAVLHMLLETGHITATPPLRTGELLLVPGRAWKVNDVSAWCASMRMIVINPLWPKNRSLSVGKMEACFLSRTDKPVCELLWGLGFTVPINMSPRARKRVRDADPDTTYHLRPSLEKAGINQKTWLWSDRAFSTVAEDGTHEEHESGVRTASGGVLRTLQRGYPLKKVWNSVPCKMKGGTNAEQAL